MIKYISDLAKNTETMINNLANLNIALGMQLQQEKNYNNTLMKKMDEMIK